MAAALVVSSAGGSSHLGISAARSGMSAAHRRVGGNSSMAALGSK